MESRYDEVKEFISLCFECTDEAQKICTIITELFESPDWPDGRLSKLRNDLSARIARANALRSHTSEKFELLANDLLQGMPIGRNKRAFETAFELLKSKLGTRKTEQILPPVKIHILAVAASFSWDFITLDLVELLRAHPSGAFQVQLLLVEPDRLERVKAGMNTRRKSWQSLSAGRVEEANDFMKELPAGIRKRFQFEIGYYDFVPHWHGVLINPGRHSSGDDGDTKWLMQGRTTWEEKRVPVDHSRRRIIERHLRVGENEYRQFNTRSFIGRLKIDLFENWFDYYRSTSRRVFP